MRLLSKAGSLFVLGAAAACSRTPRPRPPYPVMQPVKCEYRLADSAIIYAEAAVDQPPQLIAPGAQLYPQDMKEQGIQGWVRLHFVVDAAGGVPARSITVDTSSHPGFVSSAVAMLTGARFKPGVVQGHPVPTCVQQTINWAID